MKLGSFCLQRPLFRLFSLLFLGCLLAPSRASAQRKGEDGYLSIRGAGVAMHLGYTSLNEWLKSKGADGFPQFNRGIAMDLSIGGRKLGSAINISGDLNGEGKPTQMLVFVGAGVRLPVGRGLFNPNALIGYGFTRTAPFVLPSWPCTEPGGDCYLRNSDFWTALQLNQFYRFPSRSIAHLLVGGFLMPALRIGRNNWEYGYAEGGDNNLWYGTRVRGTPSTARVILVTGLTVGVDVNTGKY